MLVFENRASTILFRLLLGINNKKSFLLPANVCPIVVTTFLKAGVPFEFVDISALTLCMDEDETLHKLTRAGDRYGGVLFVRSYGTDRDVAPFFRRIKELSNQFLIIDDKCLAVPEFDGERASQADVSLYSTGLLKYVELGWGGFAYVATDTPYDSKATINYDQANLNQLQSHIKRCLTEQTPFIYTDSDWLNGSSPVVGFTEYRDLVDIKYKTVFAHKQKINCIYRENIPMAVQLPDEFQQWRFNIMVPARDELIKKISISNLFAGTNYPSLAHIFRAESAPISHQFHGTVVNLFNDCRFLPDQAWRMVEIVQRHLADHDVSSSV